MRVTITSIIFLERYMETSELDSAIALALAAAETNADQTVSEAGLLDLVLNFANNSVLSGALLHVPGIRLPRQFFEAGMKSLVIGDNGERADERPDDGEPLRTERTLVRLREQLRKDLQALSVGKQPAARLAEIHKQAGRMVLVPRYGPGSVVRYHYLPQSLDAVVAHAIVLLAGANKVARCKLPGCTAFYLRRGRPKRAIFCTDEHAAQARKKSGAERQERYRNKPTTKHK